VVTPADHDQRSDGALREILTDDFARAGATLQRGQQALATDRGGISRRRATVGNLCQGGQDVEKGGRFRYSPGSEPSRGVHDERDPASRLEEVHFVPKAALAEHVAMIRQHHDDGVIRETRFPECAQKNADLVVDVGHGPVVRAACRTHLRLRGGGEGRAR